MVEISLNQNLCLPQAGPQKTLYIPGVLFEMGKNTIHVFENYLGDQVLPWHFSKILIVSQVMRFTDTPNYGVPTRESSRKVRTGVSNDYP